MNQLITELAAFCRAEPWREKWLLVPSVRVGQQWLDQVARGGQAVMHLRPITLSRLALELSAPDLLDQDRSTASEVATRELLQHTVDRLRAAGQLRYFGTHPAHRAIADVIHDSLVLLRQGGCDPSEILPRHFDPETKGHDLRGVFRAYQDALAEAGLVDRLGIVEQAVAILRTDPGRVPANTWILIPESLELSGLDQQLVSALPAEQIRWVTGDQPSRAIPENRPASDLQRLSWLLTPDESPPAVSDQSVQFSVALDAVSEVRSVLRSCRAASTPLDQVELLHTDSGIYLPLILETFWESVDETESGLAELPITFAEGIPCYYSRPGRLLQSWVRWRQEDCPQSGLVQMWRSGWLEIPEHEPGGGLPTPGRLAGLLEELPIGHGRDRYLDALQVAQEELARKLSAAHDPSSETSSPLARRLRHLQLLDATTSELLAALPTELDGASTILTAAVRLLESQARCIDEFDQYARQHLLQSLHEMMNGLATSDDATTFDAWGWLAQLPQDSRVLGSGPRSGCLHVDHVLHGGHSGRPQYTRQPALIGSDIVLCDVDIL